MDKVHYNLGLSAAMSQELAQLADASGRSKGELLQEAVARYLDGVKDGRVTVAKKVKPPKKEAAPKRPYAALMAYMYRNGVLSKDESESDQMERFAQTKGRTVYSVKQGLQRWRAQLRKDARYKVPPTSWATYECKPLQKVHADELLDAYNGRVEVWLVAADGSNPVAWWAGLGENHTHYMIKQLSENG